MHASCLSYLLALAAAGADTQQYLRAQNNNYTARKEENEREESTHTTDGTDARCTTEQDTAMERPAERRPRVFTEQEQHPLPLAPCPHARFYSFCVWMGQTSPTDSRRSAYTILVYFLRFLRIWLRNNIGKYEI